MTKQATDANPATEGINQLKTDVDTGGAASSPARNIDNEHFDPNSDNLIDTVDDLPGGIDLATGGASKQGEEEKGKTDDKGEAKDPDKTGEKAGADDKGKGEVKDPDKAGEKASGDDKKEDYHDIPRFKEIITEKNDAIKRGDEATERATKAETELALLKKTQQKAPPAEELPFKPVQDLSAEEIAEWQNDDPKGYQENLLAQAKHEIMQDLRAESSETKRLSSIDTTYNTYQDANPDTKEGTGFMQMWESGAIKTFMQENPGHNAMSAHMKLTEKSRTDTQIAEAVAAAEKKVIDDFKAKRVTDGLEAGPSHVPAETQDEDLKDTSAKGGLVNTIAGRLFKSRQQGG